MSRDKPSLNSDIKIRQIIVKFNSLFGEFNYCILLIKF